jgi:hypothetical protein
MRAPEETPAERLRIAFELVDFVERMIRARVRRDRPDASDDEIEAAVDAWYQDRRCAPDGDAVGTVRAWPRR